MPIILRTGALFRPTENSEIEAGFFWENWSAVEDLVVTNMDMTVETVDGNFAGVEDIVITDDVVLPVGYNDVWSVRLGGQVDVGLLDQHLGRVDLGPGGTLSGHAHQVGDGYPCARASPLRALSALLDSSRAAFFFAANFDRHKR